QLRDGRRLERRVDRLLGTPELPMSRAQLLEKFWHCAGYAARPLPRERLDPLLPLIERLEGAPDVSALLDRLIGAGGGGRQPGSVGRPARGRSSRNRLNL